MARAVAREHATFHNAAFACAILLAGCSSESASQQPAADAGEAGAGRAGSPDAVASDATAIDTGLPDSRNADAAGGDVDAALADTGAPDIGTDAAPSGQTYTTTFPLTENPISEGGRWNSGGAVGLDWHDVSTT